MLPLTIFVPEAHLPAWLICYVPLLLSTFNIILDPRSTSYILPYLLFENTMSLTKSDAVISGLLSLGSSHEWIVTKKKGRRWGDDECVVKEEGGREMKRTLGMEKGEAAPKRRKEKKIRYEEEFGVGLLLMTAAARSLLSARVIHCCVLSLQGISFLVVGLGMIGEDNA